MSDIKPAPAQRMPLLRHAELAKLIGLKCPYLWFHEPTWLAQEMLSTSYKLIRVTAGCHRPVYVYRRAAT